MFSGRSILIVIVIILLIGLVASVFLSLRTTNKNSGATNLNNLNTSSQINTSGSNKVNEKSSVNPPKEKAGTLTFSIISTGTNSNLKSFLIRVKKIEVYSKSGNIYTLNMPLPINVDLVSLNGSGVANMGQTALPAENYSGIRVYIDKASIVLKNGTKSDLVVTDTSGLVIVTKDFSVEKQMNTNLNLDFVLDKSYSNNNFTPFIANLLVSN